MKKLYKIKVLHGGPKDSHESIETYLIAENDEQVFSWISDNKCYGHWCEEEDPEDYEYSLDGDYDNPVSMKEYVMANKGDLKDENGWEDAYYGVTKWGWEEISGLDEVFLEQLIYANIAHKA